jgi:hypothetical protein
MHVSALALAASILLHPGFAVAQDTLNKCIDAQGLVTYTNKPCTNAREVHKLEIDPPPVPDPARAEPTQAATPVAKSAGPAPAAIRLEMQRAPSGGKPSTTQQTGNAKHCDTLSNQLGKILDTMDQARRKGYTQDQMNRWNEKIRELELKKQQSACF